MKPPSGVFFLLLFLTGAMLSNFSSRTKDALPYILDKEQSKMNWNGYYLFSFGEHNGSIDLLEGEISTDKHTILGGYFDIDMRSISVKDMPREEGGNDLEQHLKSSDFFAVEEFATAHFKIAKVVEIPEASQGRPNYEITGELHLKGVKNLLTFPATVKFKGNRIEAKAKFKFDRTKWNIHYNSGKFFSDLGDGAISDAIGIDLNIVAVSK